MLSAPARDCMEMYTVYRIYNNFHDFCWTLSLLENNYKRPPEFLDMVFVTTETKQNLLCKRMLLYMLSPPYLLLATLNSSSQQKASMKHTDSLKRDHRHHWKLKNWRLHANKERCRQESPWKFKLKLDVYCPFAEQRGGSTFLLITQSFHECSCKTAFRLMTRQMWIEDNKLRIKQCKL